MDQLAAEVKNVTKIQQSILMGISRKCTLLHVILFAIVFSVTIMNNFYNDQVDLQTDFSSEFTYNFEEVPGNKKTLTKE